MSIIDLKKTWEEAIRQAALARQQESELADSQLETAAGLPVRSGLHAGENPSTIQLPYTITMCNPNYC